MSLYYVCFCVKYIIMKSNSQGLLYDVYIVILFIWFIYESAFIVNIFATWNLTDSLIPNCLGFFSHTVILGPDKKIIYEKQTKHIVLKYNTITINDFSGQQNYWEWYRFWLNGENVCINLIKLEICVTKLPNIYNLHVYIVYGEF